MDETIAIGGHFYAERWAPDGKKPLSRHFAKNGITLLGLNSVLEVYCRQQAQLTWKMGLIFQDDFSALASDDIISSHAGWTEVTSYSETTRPLWAPGAAASQRTINPLSVRFTMTATKNINGLFLCSDNTKGGTTGLLFCTGSFDAPALMVAGEVFRCYYLLKAEGR